jgi:hypothetical protein
MVVGLPVLVGLLGVLLGGLCPMAGGDIPALAHPLPGVTRSAKKNRAVGFAGAFQPQMNGIDADNSRMLMISEGGRALSW